MTVLEIPLDAIEPHPANARTFPAEDSEDAGLMELAGSIKAVGLLEPIVVRLWRAAIDNESGERYQLLAGERRWRAMRLVEGAKTIAAIIRDVGDREALEILVTENLQRKDLSPLEEAAGVRALVDQAGWTVNDVADRLGRSLHWVAQRARLTSLSTAWQAKAADPKSGISRWPASLLVLVARLEPHVQDGILDDWCGDDSPPARSDLERNLADLTRELRRAPWKLADAALYPEAGPCAACAKRSGCHPGLFEDEDPQKPEKTDRCLDARCWHEKTQRHLAIREAELREKHANLVLANGEFERAGLPRREDLPELWRFTAAKKTDPGAVPALVVSGHGVGNVRWVTVTEYARKRTDMRPRGEDGKPKPSSLNQRRASLDRRRRVKAVEFVKAALEAIEPYPLAQNDGPTFSISSRLLLAMAAIFGTKHQRNSSQWDGSFRDDGRAGLDRNPQAAWKLLGTMREDLGKCCTELWHEVRLVLLERLAYQGTPTDVKKLWADAEAACKMLGLDAVAAVCQAVEAIPEPKSWAKLAADGTPKGAAPAKGKAKPKAKRARKAKPKVPTCRECGCTDDKPCETGEGEPCSWVEPDLCSACADKMQDAEAEAEEAMAEGAPDGDDEREEDQEEAEAEL
jgi:ParB/RepB/Spo0J family partition protein